MVSLKPLFAACLCFGSIVVAAQTPPVAAPPPSIVRAGFIYPDTAKPTPECHATTIVDLPDGTQMASWFGGKHEKNPDVVIWTAHYQQRVWSEPVQVANGIQYTAPGSVVKRYPCWNPVLFQPKNGPLLLFYKVGASPDTWWGMLITSSDNGKTWSEPRRLPEGILGPIKNKPVLLPNGDLLCPTSSEHDGWRVYFELTPDLGRTWFRTGSLNDGMALGAIQPSILMEPEGRLVALGRSRQGNLWEASSTNQGRSWSAIALNGLPNPNSGTDAVTLNDGRHLLVFNDSSTNRTPLTVAMKAPATDWKRVLTLEDQPGEYSYPAIIQAADGMVHITYTWKRLLVKHVVVDPAKL